MGTHNWSDRRLRALKRALSTYEKSSVLSAQERALVMSGEPPAAGEVGEIEELADIGFPLERITTVECEKQLAEALYDHYGDQVSVHHDLVQEFLPRSTSVYSYMHFDFCGHLGPTIVPGLQAWCLRSAPVTRTRVSVQRTRKGDNQFNYEHSLRASIVRPFCEAAAAADRYPSRWGEFAAVLADDDDITQVIGFIWLVNFVCGLELFEYADDCVRHGPQLPAARGTHLPVNLRRFTYNEVGGHTAMVTVWCDLIARDQFALTATGQPVLDMLAAYVAQLTEPAPSFNNTELYTD